MSSVPLHILSKLRSSPNYFNFCARDMFYTNTDYMNFYHIYICIFEPSYKQNQVFSQMELPLLRIDPQDKSLCQIWSPFLPSCDTDEVKRLWLLSVCKERCWQWPLTWPSWPPHTCILVSSLPLEFNISWSGQ